MANPLSVKYRPHTLEDVVGQDVVVQQIRNSFKNNMLHHAYVFCGPYGNGKTTMARIMAAMENCEHGPTLTPCGKCKNCKAIFAGKSIDVKEIDAASNRSIDDIKDLKNETAMATIQARTKYIILDEAHSLTPQAAEAALKLIEEPPPGVRFILATTNPEKLKDTVLSRCIMVNFKKVDWYDIYQNLEKVAKMEGVKVEEEALKIAAKGAKNSVRSSLQNLQKLIQFSDTDIITADDARLCLDFVDEQIDN